MRRHACLAAFAAFAAMMLLAPPAADGYSLIYAHSGSTDPLDEGWSLLPGTPGADVTVGPVQDAAGDAWSVDDGATYLAGFCMYRGSLGPLQLQHAQAGWLLRARLRMPDSPEVPLGSPMIRFRDGDVSYQIHFGSGPDGDPIARLVYTSSNYIEVVLDGAGGGYHDYEMEWDPGTQSVTLRADGAIVATGYTGFAITDPAPRVAWGTGSSGDVGRGDFASVQFYVAGTVATEESDWTRLKVLYR